MLIFQVLSFQMLSPCTFDKETEQNLQYFQIPQRLISDNLPLCKLVKMLLQVKQQEENGWHYHLLQLRLLKLIKE